MLVLLFVLLLIILPSLTWVSLILKLHVAHKSVVASLEEGEVSSAYFFRLIKKQSADCLVAALHCPDGTVVNSPPELVECFSQFYSDLFSAELVDFAAQDVLLSNVSAHLSPSERDDCEGLLSVEECFTALQGMARRMAPLWSFILSSGVFLVRIWLEF